jgi:hypothetical protein
VIVNRLVFMVGLIGVLFFLYSVWRQSRDALANPARTSIPSLVAVMVGVSVVGLLFPIGCSQPDGRSNVLEVPIGLGAVSRGDILHFRVGTGLCMPFVVLGLPDDEVRLVSEGIFVNSELLEPVKHYFRIELPCGTSGSIVPPGHVAVVPYVDRLYCHDVELVPISRFNHRDLFVVWPPSRFGSSMLSVRPPERSPE